MTEVQRTKVVSLLSQGAHVNPKEFSLFIPFTAYRMDSLDIVGVSASIEEEFGITIPDAELPKFKCGEDVMVYLEAVL